MGLMWDINKSQAVPPETAKKPITRGKTPYVTRHPRIKRRRPVDRRPHPPITSSSSHRPTLQRERERDAAAAAGDRSQSANHTHRANSSSASAAAGHVGGDGAELHGVLRRLGPRLRGHRPHPPPPRVLLLILLRPRPQARLHLGSGQPFASRRRLGLSSLPQGPGCGVAAGAVVPEERARGGGVQGQVRQGGRRRRAVPAQGGPGGVRGLRPAPRCAPGQVLLPLYHPQGWERRDGACGRGERDGVRADVRGQGRGLDARRRRPLENVCGNLPASSSHEKL